MNHEHAQLRALLDSLEANATDQDGLVARLGELHHHLESHFASEEKPGGFFDRVREAAPWHSDRVRALEQEHAALLSSVEFISRRHTGHDPGDVQKEVLQLVALMRAHEIAEGVLYQDALAS